MLTNNKSNSNEGIQLAIADDHHLIISSIENAVKDTGYIVVCGTYTNGDDLITGLESVRPDVLLLDYHLPGQNGAQVARYITYHYSDIKIIGLTGFDKPGLSTEMLESGCMGYLLKTSANTDTIIEAIDTVYAGKMFVDSVLRNKFANNVRDNYIKSQFQALKLTNRELEVLKYIVEELSSHEIAEKLFISKRTVDNHRTSIIMKTGVKNTVGLIKFAIEMHLV